MGGATFIQMVNELDDGRKDASGMEVAPALLGLALFVLSLRRDGQRPFIEGHVDVFALDARHIEFDVIGILVFPQARMTPPTL